MNFAISSLGRCGTKSLAQLLNSNNKGIKVVHEPKSQRLYFREEADEVSKRFVENYGEVNSFLRKIIRDLKVEKKAIIIRHPHRILISAINWKPSHLNSLDVFIDYLNEELMGLDECIESGIRYIKFEHMIKGCNCLSNLISYLNLDCSTDLPKTNKKKGNIERVDQIECNVSCFDWFIKKYYCNEKL